MLCVLMSVAYTVTAQPVMERKRKNQKSTD